MTEKIEGAAKVSVEIDLRAFVANVWRSDEGEYVDNSNSILDQIIERAAKMVHDDITKDVRAYVGGSIQEQIKQEVSDAVREAMNEEFLSVNQWGERSGKATTLREQVKKEIDQWLHSRSGRYDGPKNLEKIVKDVVDRSLAQDFAKVITEEREAIMVQLRAAATVLLAKEAAKR